MVAAAALSACATPSVTNTTTALAGIVVAGHTPTTQIEQVYYLGVFDPRDQLPPTIYRVRVKGQASMLSATRFASGWVRAELIDSLSGTVQLPTDPKGGGATVSGSSVERIDPSPFSQRRLVLFGPEGFREAPRDHRLVIAMGASPEKFFTAVDQALGVVARVTQNAGDGGELERALWQDLAQLRESRLRLESLSAAVRNDLEGAR
jgi:hypothetical protein